jgi:hypothetical protein
VRKDLNDPSPEQLAKLNRNRLWRDEAARAKEEAEDKATAVRENMARLRALRLAKEAETVQTKIAPEAKPKKTI